MDDKDEALELEVRRDIFNIISKYPGAYLREIQNKLKLSTGQIEYHLNYLENKGIISGRKVDNKKRFFVDEEVNYPDRKILSILRQKTPRKILLLLLHNKELGFSQLLENFEISKSTLSFHLQKLDGKGIIKSRKDGRKKLYYIKNRNKIAQVLITYKSSFIDKAVDRFVDTWMEMRK